jgi:2-keto-4-pentenoate hydratase
VTDQARADAAAAFLLDLRRPGAEPVGNLPDDLRPTSLDEAIAIQIATLRAIGPIGGWKVGAGNAAATPVASPLPASGIKASPAAIATARHGAECEIGFTFGEALPPRETPYSRDAVIAAISTCQATIEVVSPRLVAYPALDPLCVLADLGVHGGLCVGQPIAAWDPEMFAALHVIMDVNGAKQHEATGSNPGGTDLIRLLVWLANSGVVRAAGGIAAGAVVTTGSWTGLTFHEPGTRVMARFDGFAPVEVLFETP